MPNDDEWTEEQELAFQEYMLADPERAALWRRSVMPELPKIQIYKINPILLWPQLIKSS